MNELLYYQLEKVEENHWWFQARKSLLSKLLTQYPHLKSLDGVDVGCGTGFHLNTISHFCNNVYGIDSEKIAIDIARKKNPDFNFFIGDANNLKSSLLKNNNLGLVTIFNVLYHKYVKDEKKIISDVFDLLQPGGILILNEPAFDHLKRKHDVYDMGLRRFKLSHLSELSKEIGFNILSQSYYNVTSYFPALLLAKFDQLKGIENIDENEKTIVGELKIPIKFVNQIMKMFIKFENELILNSVKLPFGVSTLFVLQKPYN